MSTPSHRADIRRGIRDALPMAASTLPWGLVFGLLAQPVFSLLQTFLMSGYVFSGTAQFVAIERLAAGSGLAAMLLAVFAVNARYLLQGITLWPFLREHGAASRVGLLFFLTDMSWALSLQRLQRGEVGLGYFFSASVTIYLGWLLGSLVGWFVPVPLEYSRVLGLDFAVAAVLIGMAGARFAGRASLLPWAVTLAVGALTWRWLPGSTYMIAGGVAGALTGAWRDTR
ncbi:MAG: AzlC family ABC transporter permease [Burkholderiaceae bacterium]|nr:AzlC family ABC transporter permease [Burkholderiaceae bacterium]